jgi:hypothetical protein
MHLAAADKLVFLKQFADRINKAKRTANFNTTAPGSPH